MNKTIRNCLLPTVLIGAWCGCALAASPGTTDHYGGRDLIVYVPPQMPAPGARALVVVLHGGLGNAERIAFKRTETGLNMDSVAEKDGFVVAYLDGTPVTRRMGADKLGWNAGGGCCGLSAEKNIDDVTYIKGAVDYLVGKYSIDRARIFGMGHSNGAMMVQRLMCESDLFTAGVSISGPLNTRNESCTGARGKHILGIHGADDDNVPIAGGQGSIQMSRAIYNSEERTRQIYQSAGAVYDLQVIQGAGHKLAEMDAAIQQSEHQTIAEKCAKFFGLDKKAT